MTTSPRSIPLRIRRLLLAFLLGAGSGALAHAQTFEWREEGVARSAALSVPKEGRSGFTRLGESTTGLGFTNHLSDARAAENQIRLSGSGIALGDVDGDGRCDIYLCRMEGANALYRNLGGWRFEEITDTAGVDCPDQWSTGAVFGDVDGDGDLDLLVSALGGGVRLFLNDGNGRFTESEDPGLLRRYGAMSMALADLDGDGDLDLYVANYRTTTVRSTGLQMLLVDGRRMLRPEDRDEMYITPDGFLREHGEPDVVYLNDGNGRFSPVDWTDGMFLDEAGRPYAEAPRGWGFSVIVRDLNGDGWPDIYVCNDFWSPDRFWLGDGRGRYREIAREALANTSSFSMGVDAADTNRDGHDDFFVLDMLSPVQERRMRQTSLVGLQPWPVGYPEERPQFERNTLFLARGDGTFAEIAQLSGLAATEWSWCPVFLDVDLDGFEDVLISNGYGFDTQDIDADARIAALGPLPRSRIPEKLLMYPRLPLSDFALRNRGDLTFEDQSLEWGFDTFGLSHGMALADLDNDGDLDVVVNNMNSAAGVYRNETSAPRVAVRLRGRGGNTRGIGGRVVLTGGRVRQSQEIMAGGRYLSSDEAARVFAALTEDMGLEVRWRDGQVTRVPGVRANRVYEVRQPEGKESTGAASFAEGTAGVRKESSDVWFSEVTSWPGYLHVEDTFDDFARQPLLPRRLSQPGPGVSWFDLDGDGRDDLIIGSGRGGRPGLFRNLGEGRFEVWDTAFTRDIVARDQTAVLGWNPAAGTTELLAGSSNYEDGSFLGAPLVRYDPATGEIDDTPRGQLSSTGPLAIADFDGDGDLDVFLGGRCIPGRYPEPATSILYRNDDGALRPDERAGRVLEQVGLVNAAVWSDLDGDGFPELILACEWGPVRVFGNAQGELTERTAELGMDRFKGLWNSVATGDFNGDGRPDLIVGNWGRNTRYEARRDQPPRMYHGDLDGNGIVEALEVTFDSTRKEWVPERTLTALKRGWPAVQARFQTHEAYGKADIDAILGDKLPGVKRLSVNRLETMLFLNRGDHFEPTSLPIEAQFSPVFGIAVADFDGDGHEDVFLAQNFFATEPRTTPYDAGRGLVLRGDGRGGFEAVPGEESGVRIYGEQRGSAVSDFNGDGRVDLAVAQNAGRVMLYRNVRGQPGLRVRLKGPPENPFAVGASLRALGAQGEGPCKEVQAGSGYWSQHSSVMVLHAPGGIQSVRTQWPGGDETETVVPPGAKELTITAP